MSSVNILAENLDFPEGPVFDPSGNLWFVEMKGGNLSRLDNGRVVRYPSGGSPNGLTVSHDGRIWACDSGHNAIMCFDPAAESWTKVVETLDGQPLRKPNDLAFDAAGNLVFTCPGMGTKQNPTGYVCCLNPDGTVRKIIDGLNFPNGLAFIDEGHTLVIAETFRKRLWKGGWDTTKGSWFAPGPWAETGDGFGPDGMALGADGLLYVAVFGSGQVKAFTSDGQIAAVYDVSGKNPTNVAFDPSGRLGLVVTEAERGLLLSLPDLGPGVPLFA